jgi:MFS family permease
MARRADKLVERMDASYTTGPLVRLCTAGSCAHSSYAICRAPLLPLFASDLGASAPVIGFVMGALVFAVLPFGYLGVTTLGMLVVLRCAHGSSPAIFGPVASASLSDVAPPSRRGTWLSLYSTAQGGGQAVGPVIAGYLLASGRFDLAFVVAGIIGVAALPIVAGWNRSREGRARAIPSPEFRRGVGAHRLSAPVRPRRRWG